MHSESTRWGPQTLKTATLASQSHFLIPPPCYKSANNRGKLGLKRLLVDSNGGRGFNGKIVFSIIPPPFCEMLARRGVEIFGLEAALKSRSLANFGGNSETPICLEDLLLPPYFYASLWH